MENLKQIASAAKDLGYPGNPYRLYEIRDWLREQHQIHVEIGSIWDETGNFAESRFYTVTAPVFMYHKEQMYSGGGKSLAEVLQQGVVEGLAWLKEYKAQEHLEVTDDQVVIAYLKGYRDKDDSPGSFRKYRTNLENYAYLQGRQGDYIEEGLTEDDIVRIVRNEPAGEEKIRLE